MCIQLSLFDLPGNFDTVSPVVPAARLNDRPVVAEPSAEYQTPQVQAQPQPPAQALQPIRIYGESRPHDSIQPMGDLAQLVLARYDMVARRREEMNRRKAEQPRKSIRVLGPVSA